MNCRLKIITLSEFSASLFLLLDFHFLYSFSSKYWTHENLSSYITFIVHFSPSSAFIWSRREDKCDHVSKDHAVENFSEWQHRHFTFILIETMLLTHPVVDAESCPETVIRTKTYTLVAHLTMTSFSFLFSLTYIHARQRHYCGRAWKRGIRNDGGIKFPFNILPLWKGICQSAQRASVNSMLSIFHPIFSNSWCKATRERYFIHLTFS